MKNVKVINKFDSVVTGLKGSEVAYVTPNGLQFVIIARGCNYYGNPTFHLYMDDESMEKVKNCKNRCGRVLLNKKIQMRYLTFTSYNLSSSLAHLFEKSGIETELEK